MVLDFMAEEIQNSYFQSPSSENHYIICGPEFGLEIFGKVALIERALYEGRLVGWYFFHHLSSYMYMLGF